MLRRTVKLSYSNLEGIRYEQPFRAPGCRSIANAGLPVARSCADYIAAFNMIFLACIFLIQKSKNLTNPNSDNVRGAMTAMVRHGQLAEDADRYRKVDRLDYISKIKTQDRKHLSTVAAIYGKSSAVYTISDYVRVLFFPKNRL